MSGDIMRPTEILQTAIAKIRQALDTPDEDQAWQLVREAQAAAMEALRLSEELQRQVA